MCKIKVADWYNNSIKIALLMYATKTYIRGAYNFPIGFHSCKTQISKSPNIESIWIESVPISFR